MGRTAFLRRLVHGEVPAAPATQRSAAEAIALAKAAAGDHWLRDRLSVATAQRNDAGAVVWRVESGGVGAHLAFVIDDASGAVLSRDSSEGR